MGALKNNRGPRLKSLNEISDGLIESILKITDDPIQVKDQITGDLVAIFSILYSHKYCLVPYYIRYGK